jgi:hypothetical protein
LALLRWERVLEVPVVSIAFGKKRMAVLAADESTWIQDRGAWREAPMPEALRRTSGEHDDARIFFGRDDWPRIMGTRWTGPSGRMIYLRYKGGWRREPGEIGRLATGADAPLYGVLGHDDPEVVCKQGVECIIKRLTGWTMVPPASEPLLVELWSGQAWGVGSGGVQRLAAKGWQRVADAPGTGGLFAAGDTFWVSDDEGSALHFWDGARYSRHASPIDGPRALWGSSATDVWVAGAGGVGRWDGKAWQRVESPQGALADVRGRDAELWVGGKSGLWRGTR